MTTENKLDLQFELTYIGNRNVTDIVLEWQQIYDKSPQEALWILIQLCVDSTGYLDTKVDHSKTFEIKRMNGIVKRISTRKFVNEKFILNSSKLRENVTLFLTQIIITNREAENFLEVDIATVIEFLLKMVKRKEEIFYATGSIISMTIISNLIELGEEYFGNGINNLILNYAPKVFANLQGALQFQDCVYIICPLFCNAFIKLKFPFFCHDDLKNLFEQMLQNSDPAIISRTLEVIKIVLDSVESEQSEDGKWYLLNIFAENSIMIALFHDATGTKKRIALVAHEIVNIMLAYFGADLLKQNKLDYAQLLLRIYDTNQGSRKLAGKTFNLVYYPQNIIEMMIIFHLKYQKYHNGNISNLVEACCLPNQIDLRVKELIAILGQFDVAEAYKPIGGQILLHLYKNILPDYNDLSSNLLEQIPSLLSAIQDLPQVTINLLEIITFDVNDADDSVLMPIIEFLAEFVITHTNYEVLAAANRALYKLSTQRDQSFHAGIVQSIYHTYNSSRNKIQDEPDTYKIHLIRFRAAAEFTECVYEYLDENFLIILDTLYDDLSSKDVDEIIAEHQIILYTTLVNAACLKHTCAEMVERTTPFLEYLVGILANSTIDSMPNTLLSQAVIPGICMFYIMASDPIDLNSSNNINRIENIPSHIYVNIRSVLVQMSATIFDDKSNMGIMKKLLKYWINLHKVQKVPNHPQPSRILILYGNVEELSHQIEELLMTLYDTTSGHTPLIASIGQSFVNLLIFDKLLAKNYTNSLYKFFTRSTTKIEKDELLELFASILIYVISALEERLKVSHSNQKNRLGLFNYLYHYLKWLKGKRNDRIIQIINRILQFNTISLNEMKTLNNIKTQLGC